MKKLNVLNLVFLLFLFLIAPHTKGQNFTEFKSILDDCGMNVNIPNGFIESSVVKNRDMNYEYAIKYPDKDFELRYAIRPIRHKSYANDTVKNEMESHRPFRNSQYGMILQTVVLNITGGISYKIQAFDKNSVKEEFNADWGATTFVDLKSEFGKGYKYCMIVAIHKTDVADAYYFYLSNTKENFPENMNPLFHTLKFDK